MTKGLVDISIVVCTQNRAGMLRGASPLHVRGIGAFGGGHQCAVVHGHRRALLVEPAESAAFHPRLAEPPAKRGDLRHRLDQQPAPALAPLEMPGVRLGFAGSWRRWYQ